MSCRTGIVLSGVLMLSSINTPSQTSPASEIERLGAAVERATTSSELSQALRSLAGIPDPAALEMLDRETLNVNRFIASEASSVLTNLHWDRIPNMAGAFARPSPTIFEGLVKSASSPSKDVRRNVAVAVSQCRDPERASQLVGLLTNGDPAIRASAGQALAALGPATADALMEALNRDESELKVRDQTDRLAQFAFNRDRLAPQFPFNHANDSALDVILPLLGKLREPRATDRLAQILSQSQWPSVRAAAAYALREIRPSDPRIVDRLIALVDNEDRNRAFLAAEVLRALPDPRVREALRTYERRNAEWTARRATERADLDREVKKYRVDQLRTIVKRRDLTAKFDSALQELAAMPNAAAQELVAEAVHDGNPAVARRAVTTLGKVEPITPPVQKVLLTMVNSRDPAIRAGVAQGLGNAQPPPVEPLLKLASDKDAEVRTSATKALGKSADDRALTRIVQLVKDADPVVREVASNSLVQWARGAHDPRAADKLMRLLEQRQSLEVQLAAADALKQIKPQDPQTVERLAALLSLYKTEDTMARADIIAHLLQDLGDDRAAQALKAYNARVDQWFFEVPGGICSRCSGDNDCPGELVCLTFTQFGSDITKRCARRGTSSMRCRE